MTIDILDCAKVLKEMQDAWNAAARVWNPQALASLYADNSLFYGGRPGHSVGAKEAQKYFASYDKIIRSAVLDLIEQELIPLGADSFLAQGFGAFSFVLEGGQATNSVLRTTLVLVRRQGSWLIQLHHFSPTPEVPPLGNH